MNKSNFKNAKINFLDQISNISQNSHNNPEKLRRKQI